MTWKDKLGETRNGLRNLNGAIPDTTLAFNAMGKTVKKSGALDFKTKEFVALGISIGIRCEPCISLHVEALVKAGATREELGDVLAMSIQMGGGPAMMYAAKALECYDELAG
ncbi:MULTISPECIES: carboxymuconolactone decarboxylase family protein [unclassified Sulfitobacter]|jgi:AhpD family alkylhydroperoxidase|uniref:carboxymuconolactone decarboxylase family protein n=1 Tax=unclassified Sulfitobacter TaxID=196795 RepID=UPI001594A385|nr:carboxymuconolactone decarboxylase family protein [Sulfitobacter sp. HGT1]MBQ0804629.1 carboxymuconolactone decarboxylase family protein [Sulfitobacter sp.]